jgi:hypothetical protein
MALNGNVETGADLPVSDLRIQHNPGAQSANVVAAGSGNQRG